MQAAQELQRSGGDMFHLEDMDFGRRLAMEKEMYQTMVRTVGHICMGVVLFGRCVSAK